MNEEQLEYVVPAETDQRLDGYCCTLPGDYSREYIKRLVKEGAVLVNGKQEKVSHHLKGGEIITLNIPEPIECRIEPENIPLVIVYEDEDVLIINKPQGMVVHPAPGNRSGTLVNALMHYTANLSTINGIMRPGIIHRIDKDTSGLLMVAKNDHAHQSLSMQLKEHTTLRQYYGLVKGVVKSNRGTINMPIGRHPRERIKMAVTPLHSKEAVTHFEVMERYAQYTFVCFRLETGRTHQIRVHMENIGHPIAGDPIYGKGDKNNPFKTQGQCLHAQTLGFVHPRTGENLLFEAPLPPAFQKILDHLK
ncbi:RluA family pseudouridine synthase [Acetobacterium bakii]|uniref:Pseudouridine synthase n=1 Tax=Acetobacterium bakii TaxID=52689 RepID=A0A0L6TX45_9FIRM|nr:RluA family pseudouridine synthase [Acetobacterium bakii]KNZ40145.1 pseudouridine synthase [Acetobacterium bakii]